LRYGTIMISKCMVEISHNLLMSVKCTINYLKVKLQYKSDDRFDNLHRILENVRQKIYQYSINSRNVKEARLSSIIHINIMG
jgi:hypothetical protein